MGMILYDRSEHAARSQVVGRTTSPRFRPPARETIEITGTYKVQIHAKGDGYKIIKLEDGSTVKLTDSLNTLRVGVQYRFSGYWKESRGYKDFHASHFTVDKPTNERGIVSFLQRECPNIGLAKAREIWKAFGEQAIEVVRSSPEKITAAGILGHTQATQASEAIAKKDGMEQTKIELVALFSGFHLLPTIDSCIKQWGSSAPDVIRRDPFKLMVKGFHGAGYDRCDTLYQKLGLPLSRLKRQMLAAWYKLKNNRDGNTWVSKSSLGLISERALALGVRAKWIETRTDSLGKQWYANVTKANDEREIVKHVRRLMKRTTFPDWPAIAEIEGLSDHQRAVLASVLTSPVCMLGGKPGTGKSFVIGKLIKRLAEIYGEQEVGGCAPTGRATRRVQQNLFANDVNVEAKTIHSMFALSIEDDDSEHWNPRKPGIPRFVILDEDSMPNASVMARLLAELPDGVRLLLVGDINQLPPIGHGAPVRDMIQSKAIPFGELTEIRRNSGMIVQACHQIAAGKKFVTTNKYDPEVGANLRVIYSVDNADTVKGILRVHSLLPKHGFDPIRDCNTIVALNSNGDCSRDKVNEVLQTALNPDGKGTEKKKFRVGDKVMFFQNLKVQKAQFGSGDVTLPASYLVSAFKDEVKLDNGDIGYVLAVDDKATVVEFSEPKRVVKLGLDLESSLDLAYAITCHKFQGAECPVIVVVLDPAATHMCDRSWLYTAISRAKQLCILVGPAGLAEKFCTKVSISRRKTFLSQLLKGGV